MKAIDILVCPKCKGDLEHKKDALICENCRLRYKIIDGIPDMIIEDASPF